ncbi:MAG: hypothetical protein R3E76_04745 [Planctomycetota bacterium]
MLIVAIAAAGGAAIFPDICQTCGSSQQPVHVVLALSGGFVYSMLLALVAIARTRTTGAVFVLFGAGFQLVLLKSMFDSSAWCASCIVAGASVIGASFFLVVGSTVSSLRSVVAPVAGIAAGLLLVSFLEVGGGPSYDAMPAEYQPLLLESKDLCMTLSGSNCIVVFEREGCAACNVLKDPAEKRELETITGQSVHIARKAAPDGVTAPTVIVSGNGRTTVFRGAPVFDQLVTALKP